MFVIMAAVLVGLAGMSVDLGNWYLHIQRAQRAADAAALDGAIFVPQDPVRAAQVARDSLVRNGVSAEEADAADVRQAEGHPEWLSVTVPTTAKSYFFSLLGMAPKQGFVRESTATFHPPLGAGDFSNALGNEPPGDQWQPPSKANAQGQFWLNIGGGEGWKVRGDQFNAQHCFSSGPQGYSLSPVAEPSGCTGDRNDDYAGSPDGIRSPGYDFIVQVKSGYSGDHVAVQAYDPSFVWQADACNDAGLAALYSATSNPLFVTGQTEYCTGDENYLDTPDPLPTTYMQVFDDRTGLPVAGCTEHSFAPYGGPGDPLVSHATDPAFLAVFRQWVPLCNAPYDSVNGSVFRVHVSTTEKSQGFNRFSLRAALFAGATLEGPSVQDGVRMYGKNSIPLWANFDGADTRLALTYVPPSMAGSAVDITFYDMGDADKPGTFSLVSSSYAADATNSCEIEKPNTSSFVSMPNCKLSGVLDDNGYDGYIVRVKWHVPNDYACNPTGLDPLASCYVFVRAQYPVGVQVNDATTWTVKPDGQLLRLLPNP